MDRKHLFSIKQQYRLVVYIYDKNGNERVTITKRYTDTLSVLYKYINEINSTDTVYKYELHPISIIEINNNISIKYGSYWIFDHNMQNSGSKSVVVVREDDKNNSSAPARINRFVESIEDAMNIIDIELILDSIESLEDII